MTKSSIRSKIFFKRDTSDPSPPLVEDQLYWCRRRTTLGNSALNTEPQTKSQSGTDTQFPRLMTFLTNSRGENFFNKVDVKFGYHQVPIEPTDVWKKTYKFKEGLFE